MRKKSRPIFSSDEKKCGKKSTPYLHFALPPPGRRLLTARASGFLRDELGVSGMDSGPSVSCAAAEYISESSDVSESLTWHGFSVPAGVAATNAEKYFSCSTLVDVSPLRLAENHE